jgi:hypothetical protein
VTEEITTSDDEIGAQVEGLTRDLARVISAAPPGLRERLRDMAVHLLRDEVEIIRKVEAEPPSSPGPFNPFGIGIPLLLAGAVLLPLFGAVGLLLFGAAAVMMAWGVAAIVFGSRQP